MLHLLPDSHMPERFPVEHPCAFEERNSAERHSRGKGVKTPAQYHECYFPYPTRTRLKGSQWNTLVPSRNATLPSDTAEEEESKL